MTQCVEVAFAVTWPTQSITLHTTTGAGRELLVTDYLAQLTSQVFPEPYELDICERKVDLLSYPVASGWRLDV